MTDIKGVHPRLVNMLLTEAGIPPRVRGQEFTEFPATAKQRAAYSALAHFVRDLHDHYVSNRRPIENYPLDRSKMGKGILLAGPAGTGKTTMAALAAQHILYLYRLPVFFTAYAEVIANSIAAIRAEKSNDEEEMVRLALFGRKCYEIPVLVLDDVGKERRTGSGYAEDEFDRIIRYRYRHTRPTIITTNLGDNDWTKVYNPSMGSFIQEAFDTYGVTGVDLRAQG